MPIDPSTGFATGKNIVVSNISLGNEEVIPLVSGTAVANENPVVAANPDNGILPPPYKFTLASLPAKNKVTVRWYEAAILKVGTFLNTGLPTGDFGLGSSINFATKAITVYTKGYAVVDAGSIRVAYTSSTPPVPPEDATVNSQHILSFLADDFAVPLDRHDPEDFQRSFVNHSFQLWDIKGTADGYKYMGAIAGYFVRAYSLYRIDPDLIPFLPILHVYEIPAASSKYYTDIEPRISIFEEVPADIVPVDLHDFASTFPELTQNVTVTSVSYIQTEGPDFRYRVVVTPAAGEMQYSLAFPHAEFVDSAAVSFAVENFELLSSATYQFDTLAPNIPSVGVGTVSWKAIVFTADIDLRGSIASVESLGAQYFGFEGYRYRLVITLADASAAAAVSPCVVGNWSLTTDSGISSWIESMEADGADLVVEIVCDNATPPTALQDVAISYNPPFVTDCGFCRASMLRILMTPGAILASVEAMQENPVARLTNRLSKMVPAHIRAVQYVYDIGPAIAAMPDMIASSEIAEMATDVTAFSALYDDDEAFPADDIADDMYPSSPYAPPPYAMFATTSTAATVSPYTFEEHVDGSAPLFNGWTATGLWHVGKRVMTAPTIPSNQLAATIRPSGSAMFIYGSRDPVAPYQIRLDLNSFPHAGDLTSPVIPAIAAATSVTVIFWHYANVSAGLADFMPSLEIVDSVGAVLQTFDKTALSIAATGQTVGVATPHWKKESLDIKAAVVGAGTFRLKFRFDTVTAVPAAQEGWYIDDVYVKVVP